MTVAVIADVHGNAWALDAVLADARASGATTFLDLGDTLDGPLDPTGTADRLIELGALTVRGNHDRLMLEGGGAPIGPEHRAWLATFPLVATYEDIVLFHGSPRDDLEFLVDDCAPDGTRTRSPEEIAPLVEGIDAGLILCGHTHSPRLIELADGRWVCNPGSVGLQAYREHEEPRVGDRHGKPARPLRAPAPRRRALARRAPLRRLRLGRRHRRRAGGGQRGLDRPAGHRLARAVTARAPLAPRVPGVLEPAAAAFEHDARLVELALDGDAVPDLDARGLELVRLRMTGVELDGAQLLRPSLQDAELVRCSLAGALVREGSLSRVAFDACRLAGITWSEGTLEDVTFRDCRLELASFRFAGLQRVAFEDCVLREADFAEARCRSVRFERCDLEGAAFAGARFADAELRGCTLDGVTGVEGLRGAALEWPAIVGLAGTFAAALGIEVLDDG